MRKILLALLLTGSVTLLALTTQTAQGAPQTTVNCSDYYKLGSVYAALKTDNFENVSGTTMKFTGEIKNNNNFPISNGKLFARVVKKSSTSNDIIASFVAKDTISVASKSSSLIDFKWKIPAFAISGNYEIQTYFILGDNFYMSGLPYLKDMVESKLPFKVVGEQEKSVYFDLQNIDINEGKFDVYDFDKILKENEDAHVAFTISNDTADAQVVLVKISLYTWDSQDKNDFLKEVEQKYIIEANSSIKVPYTLDDKNHASYYVLAQALYRDVTSEVGIKFSREGTQEPRTVFSTLKNYPLVKGEDNSVVTCFNSVNSEIVEYGKVISTLYSKNGKEISTSEYEGTISPSLQGIETKFVTHIAYKDLVLETKIYNKEGKIIDQTRISYQCSSLSDNCQESFDWGFLGIVVSGIILIVLVLMIIKNMEKRDAIVSLVFLCIISGMFFPLSVKAADINGTCSNPLEKYICSTGDSRNNGISATQYTWDCKGSKIYQSYDDVSCALNITKGACSDPLVKNQCSTSYGMVNVADSATQYLWKCEGPDDAETVDDVSCALNITKGACSNPLVENQCSTSYGMTNVTDSSTEYLWKCNGPESNETVDDVSCASDIIGVCDFEVDSCLVGTFSDLRDSSTEYFWKCKGPRSTSTSDDVECSIDFSSTGNSADDIFATGGWTTIYTLWGVSSGGFFSIPSLPNVQPNASLGTISVKYTTTNLVPPRIDLYLPKSANSYFSSRAAAETWYNNTIWTRPINRIMYSKYTTTNWDRHIKAIGNPNNISASLSGTAPNTPGIYYFPMGSIVTGVDAGVRGGKASTGRYCVLGGGHCLGELGTPTLIAASNTCNSVDLTWATVQNADSYELFQENSSGGWNSLGTNVNSPYPRVTGLSEQTTYRFKLVATNNGDGFTEKTESIASVNTGICDLCAGNTPPTAPTVTVSPTTLNVGDTATFSFSSTDAQNDTITYQIDWGGGVITTETSPTLKSWTTAGTKTIKVKALDTCWESAWTTKTIVVNALPVLDPLSATADPDCWSVVLNWNNNTATSYQVFRKEGTGSYSSVSPILTTTTFTDTTITNGHTYIYQIWSGKETISRLSNEVSATSTCPPSMDLCNNIEDIQIIVPAGLNHTAGNCVCGN